MIQTQTRFCQEASIREVIDRIFMTGQITRSDEAFLLKATVSETPLTFDELIRVRQVIEQLRKGVLKLVD